MRKYVNLAINNNCKPAKMKDRLKLAFFIIFIFFGLPSQSQDVDNEWIKVYFNMPSDTTLMLEGNKSNHSWDLISTLTDLIDSAKTSVDLSAYDLEHMQVGDALANAKARGVQVRVVTDNYNRTDGGELDLLMWTRLAVAGIYSIDDDGDVYRPDGSIEDNKLVNAGADMHHKFAVIDYKSDDKNNAYVWAGSTNVTYTGAYNTNNTMVFKHTDIAKIFTEEFEQMWGSSGPLPNPQKARFHKDKRNVSQNIFDVGGTKVELYFAPLDRDKTKPSISDRIVEVVKTETDNDIRFLSFAITPTIDISQAMWNKSEDKSIRLEGVIDPSFYSRYKKAGDIWGSPEATMDNRLILPGKEMRKLHHKLILIDASNEDPDDVAVVITGSYNFSNNAEFNNDENLFIIYSNEIANQYYQDFGGVQSRALGKTYAPTPPFDENEWHNVYTVRDGATFEVEIGPGFGYPVRLLGVSVPGLYAGPDSSFYYATQADAYVRNLIEGRRVKIKDFDGGTPYASNNTFYGYVTIETESGEISLNQLMLQNGYGTTNNNFKQHPDSVAAFREYSTSARTSKTGIWEDPDKIWTRVPKQTTSSGIAVEFPININEADQETLQHLPGIGPAYAKRIIEYREQIRGFTSIEELINVKGIGEKRLEKIRPLVSVD